MGGYIYISALRDFGRARRLFPWAIGAIICAVLAVFWKRTIPSTPDVELYGQIGFIIVYKLLALSAAIFSTAVVSQEVEQKTIVYMLTRPIPRSQLLFFRYLAAVTVSAGVAIFCLVATAFAVYGASGIAQPIFYRDCVALIIGAFAYCSLFVLISLIFNRAMLICLMYAFGWETMIPNLPGDMYYLSIFSHLSAIAEHPASNVGKNFLNLLAGQLGLNLLTPRVAYPAMIILIGACCAIGAWWFTRFEYVPREDAE